LNVLFPNHTKKQILMTISYGSIQPVTTKQSVINIIEKSTITSFLLVAASQVIYNKFTGLK